MYRDQHTVASLGTARLLSRNAPAYEEYLLLKLGRPFVLSNPVETHAPLRVKARFVTDKAASGEKDGPFINLWVEYNPAMGLYSVWGEYFVPPNYSEPVYRSSPRSGYDDEMLSDPFRLFDWLTAVASGQDDYVERVMGGVVGMQTPAGRLDFVDIQTEEVDGVTMSVCRLDPEFRVPRDYYTSGTIFPGPLELTPRAAKRGPNWRVAYQMPVQNAVQRTLDQLYGEGSYGVEIDPEGYVYVVGLQPVPPQDGRLYVNDPPPSIAPRVTQAGYGESREWYAEEILRMAGVGNHVRLAQNRLTDTQPARRTRR